VAVVNKAPQKPGLKKKTDALCRRGTHNCCACYQILPNTASFLGFRALSGWSVQMGVRPALIVAVMVAVPALLGAVPCRCDARLCF
jgi:hypothetical protein